MHVFPMGRMLVRTSAKKFFYPQMMDFAHKNESVYVTFIRISLSSRPRYFKWKNPNKC
jgi:hypothetical protein